MNALKQLYVHLGTYRRQIVGTYVNATPSTYIYTLPDCHVFTYKCLQVILEMGAAGSIPADKEAFLAAASAAYDADPNVKKIVCKHALLMVRSFSTLNFAKFQSSYLQSFKH